jgi:endonuclease/exonuclease/phosphatase family metal-dependent hydrolase
MGWHGNALLVRKSATILHHAPLYCPHWSRAARCWPISARDGRELRVVGMHLDLSGLWRRRQVHAILPIWRRSRGGCLRS